MFMRTMRPARRVAVRPVGSPLLRGALVGSAACAAGESRAPAQADEAAQDQAVAEPQNRPAAAPPAAPTPAAAVPVADDVAADDVASKLAQLGTMMQQELLTPEEFTAAKAKLLS